MRLQIDRKSVVYGCLDVGAACESEADCCSGLCEVSQGKRICKAHDTGGCSAGAQFGDCGGTDISCTTSAGAAGVCGTTTGKAAYCLASAHCVPCKTDVDCQEAFDGVFGPRAACLPCAECPNTEGTLCAFPFVPEKFSLDGPHG